MINLSNVGVPVLNKKVNVVTDNTEMGYISLNSEKANSVFVSPKAVKSLGIDVDKLTKDNTAYLCIFPQVEENNDELNNWYIAQVTAPVKGEKRARISCGRYKSYTSAKYTKTNSTFTSKIMSQIIEKEFEGNERILLEVSKSNPKMFKLVTPVVEESNDENIISNSAPTTGSDYDVDNLNSEVVNNGSSLEDLITTDVENTPEDTFLDNVTNA